MKCTRKINGSVVSTNVTMQLYFKDCYNKNLLCNNSDSAFLPALTVCILTPIQILENTAPTANFIFTPSSAFVGQTVSFIDTSAGNPTSWLWDFGDGGTSTLKNPTHIYNVADDYDVKLTATNSLGSDDITKTVTIHSIPSPVANFTYTPPTPHTNELVTFTDTSTNNPTSWSWDFGDGGTSTLRNPTHTYLSANSYNAQLTAINFIL